jgi:tetratricopeptide (TPR) repeat protein
MGGAQFRPVAHKLRPLDLEQLRYQFRENPCLANEAFLASALYDCGEWDEAEVHYRGVLERDSGYQRALYGLSLCYMAQGNHAAATCQLRTLLDQDRSYADYQAWLDLAASLAATGDGDKSLECLEGLLAASPRMDHSVALAQALIEAGRAEEARAHLERAVLDFEHAPRHVKKQFGKCAREASQILGRIA